MGDWRIVLGISSLVIGGLLTILTVRIMRREMPKWSAARREKFRQRELRAVWAAATVVSVQRTETLPSGTPRAQADLHLKVQPPGGEAYLAQARWVVDLAALAQMQPGAQLSVKIDAEDPQVIYPNLNGAEIWIV